jgi:hypothetical protein
MAASMHLRIKLGPLVSFDVEGDNCREIAQALEGFEDLNVTVEAMFRDLAGRVYPEGVTDQETGFAETES